MFKIKAPDGTNNLCGRKIAKIRAEHNPPLSQRKLAQMLQVRGYDVDHHFIRRVELGTRFVTDIELVMLADVLNISLDDLLRKVVRKIMCKDRSRVNANQMTTSTLSPK